MKTIGTAPSFRTLLAAAAIAGVLAGCSAGGTEPGTDTPSTGPATTGAATASGSGTPSAPPTGTGEGAVGPDEQAVEVVLRAYQGAIASGDFGTACSLNTAESSGQLVAAVQAGGGQVGTCEEALFAVFSQPGAAGTAAEAATTTAVDGVAIEGLNATITWTSTRQGQPRTDSVALQSVDGQWRLAGTA